MEMELIREIIAEVMKLELEEVTPESRFTEDLACDSLDILSMVAALEERFQLQIPNTLLSSLTQVSDIAEVLKTL